MASLATKLRGTQKKACEKGHWPVAVAAGALLIDEENLDNRINLIGALQEVGLLQNSLEPYWKAWRNEAAASTAWAQRCLERLKTSDHDYWALAGLLGLHLATVKAALNEQGFRLLSVRFAGATPTQPLWHIATFAGKAVSGRVIAPLLEVGWETETGVINEASRWRAVILDAQEVVNESLVCKGTGSYYLRAKLPYGCWRIHDDVFELKAEWLVVAKDTLLAASDSVTAGE